MKLTRFFIHVIFLTLLLSSCKFVKSHKMFNNKMDSIATVIEELPEIIEEADSTEIETIVQETEPIVMPEETSMSAELSTGYGNDNYYMVVGSFLSKKLAQTYARKMQDDGYRPQVIYSSSLGFYRVSAASYNDFNLAVNEISNFRDNVTPRAWVHVKK